MVGEQIRSGRSTRRGEPADEVVVVGRGPIASAVAAAWGEHVRTIDELPVESATSLISHSPVVMAVAGPPSASRV